jgi:urease accessory protein
MLSVLQPIWQADGTFPSGSFAFSYGVSCGALGGMAAAGSVLMIAPSGQLADIAEIEAAADSSGCLAGVTAAPNRAGLAMRLLALDGGTVVRGIEAAFHIAARAALGVDLAFRRK